MARIGKSAHALLVKMAKGVKGSLLHETFVEVAPLLGFKTERCRMPRPGTSAWASGVLEIAAAPGGVYGIRPNEDRWEDRTVTVYTRDLHDKPKAWQRDMIAKLAALPNVTMLDRKVDPPLGHYPGDGMWLRDMKGNDGFGGWVEVRGTVWSTCDGILITGESVGGCPLWLSRNGRGEERTQPDNEAGFWTWFYKVADGKARAEKVLASLGDDAPRRAEHASGDDSNTGMCQICLRRQKMKVRPGGFIMVDHGYHHELAGELRGYLGQRQGSCYGVGGDPWERSRDRLGQYLTEVVKPHEARLRTRHELFARGGVVELVIPFKLPRQKGESFSAPARYEDRTYNAQSTEFPGRANSWEELLSFHAHAAESDWNRTKEFLAREQSRYDGWAPRPLRDEVEAARG